MKILITSQYNSQNTYVTDIACELSNFCEVVTEPQNFWSSNFQFDIVHIQWPEELFGWKSITEDDLVKLKNRIFELKNRQIKIVTTLHNQLPHRKQKLDQELYDLVYNNADCIINLGQYSKQLYPTIRNEVIFHPNYNKHFNVKSQKLNDIIFLSFGSIRTKEEEQQIIDGFIKANIANAKLIVTNSLIGKNPYNRKKDLFLKLKYKLQLKYYNKKGLEFITKRLTNEEVNHYFNQASIIITPRITNLNSGVVFMGFTFGKPIIGPSVGNIKEVLEQNNNFTFIPNDIRSIAEAMRNSLNSSKIGLNNKEFSDEFLDIKLIALKHINIYKSLL